MLRKIIDMPIPEARYIILKSLDTRDRTGVLIMNCRRDALNIVSTMINNILNATTLGSGGLNAFEFQPVSDILAFI